MKNNHKLLQQIVLISVMSAMCFALTYIAIPFGTSKVHLGNFCCILASLLFGPFIGGISGSLGMGLNDILSGYPPQTFIRTIVAKFIMGLVCGLLFLLFKKKEKVKIIYLLLPLIIFFIIGTTSLIIIITKGTSFAYHESTVTISVLVPIVAYLIFGFLLLGVILSKNKGNEFRALLIAITYATILNFVLEFVLKILFNTMFTGSFEASVIASILSIPSVILTGVVTIIISPILYYPISRSIKTLNIKKTSQ